MSVLLVLSDPLDQPERLKCRCGCDHFKINLEASWSEDSTNVVNSVECEHCHEIYTVNILP